MGQFDLLRYVATVVEGMGLRYFVTGSTATIFYGEPRFTNDIDVVVDIPEPRLIEFCRHFPYPDYYLSDTAAREAVRAKTQFNIIHEKSGLKVDVIIPQLNAFNESRFARIRRVEASKDFFASFASAEDAIIKKMEYFQEGGSEKHLRDIAAILKVRRFPIDIAYIGRWADQMGLADVWRAILEKTPPHP
jgi:hypothetical protein